MLVDGKAIAKEILNAVRTDVEALSRTPTLAAVTCAPNFETKKYLEMKKRKAASVGISLSVIELPESATTAEAVACVQRIAQDADGVVVQLPLPPHIDRDVVLTSVPMERDPDAFGYDGDRYQVLPPVAGAIDELSKRHGVGWEGKRVVVLGHGRLVGQPAARYAGAKGAKLSVLTEENFDTESLRQADILITGIGQPRFVTPEMVQDGVIVFDAGTSEDGGELVGDVDPAVADKAALFTPVPGGIGPLTIALLLRNLLGLVRQ